MAILQYNPTSAGRRGGSVSDFADCTQPRVNNPEKSLLRRAKKKGGRNNQGIVTSRFRGGGHKQRYREIDFKRKRDGVEATVIPVGTFHSGMQLPTFGSTASVSPLITLSPAFSPVGARM